MANGEHIEVAKAFVTIVPSLEGSQKIISEELGASTDAAAKDAGEKSGKTLGEGVAAGLKATAAVIAAAMAAATAAAVATGKAFISAANDVAEWGDTVDKESQKMNMTAEGYQTWAFILEHAGASIDGMKTAMKKLTIAAEENNDAFAALGISQEQLAEMSPEETWNATIAALQNVADEGERTALANELLGKGAVELAPLFNMTAEETEELKTQVKDLGGIMSDDAVKAAAEFEDELQNMKVSLKGVKNSIMSQFLPGMSSVMKGLSMVFSGQGGLEEIRTGLDSIISQITTLTPTFLELASVIVMSLLDAFGPMLPGLLSGLFGFLNEALVSLVVLVPTLLPVITSAVTSLLQIVFQCLPLITSSLLTLVTDLATWLASGDNVKTFSNGIVLLVTSIVKQIGMVLPILLPAIVSIISQVATTITTPENIALILDAVLLVIGAVIMALANSVPEFIEYYVGLATNIKNTIMEFFNWVSPYLSQAWNAISATVSGWVSSYKNSITNGFNTVKNTITNWANSVKATIFGWITGIQISFTSWLNNLKTGFATAFATIQQKVTQIVAGIQGFVQNAISVLQGLPSAAVSMGQDLIKGLWNGISDKDDWVIEKIKGLGNKIINAIKKQFGIASPSKVFAEIGDFMAQGLGVGWEDGIDDVKTDMQGAADGLTATMTADISSNVGGRAADIEETTYNGGATTINVYGAEGQDENALAQIVAEKLEDMKRSKEAVYA